MTVKTQSLHELMQNDLFVHRHIGPNADQQTTMLKALGYKSLEDLIDDTVPSTIRSKVAGQSEGKTEPEALVVLQQLASKNKVYQSYIGMGYYHTFMPSVILRNVFSNPGWYSAYTPYQPEISQGRLEALLNFQQMVMDFTGMAVANASLLDESTAAAEAMALCRRASRNKSSAFFVADDVHPQTLDVLKTRAEYMGIEIIVGDPQKDLTKQPVFGLQLQYPNTYGVIQNIEDIIKTAKAQNTMVAVATDLLALNLLKSPGEMGADIAIGSSQRFGVPIGFGGPHAAFFATSDKFKRAIPGRIIGVSVDSRGQTAYRMTMQTREQHIRRDKATSNICTAQALLANLAAFYAVYHGAEGLKSIAKRTHLLTTILKEGLHQQGFTCNDTYFDTLTVDAGNKQQAIYQQALTKKCNFRLIDQQYLGISLDETTDVQSVVTLLNIFAMHSHKITEKEVVLLEADILNRKQTGIPVHYLRTDSILTHPVFNRYHSETDMMRYLKILENKDYSLVHGMIPLGSCTMKLNAASEMLPVTWPEFSCIHPFAPKEQTQGYFELIKQMEHMLIQLTGYDGMSLQPNSGASGEYAGLLAIRKYQASIGEAERNICLIPSSAHGTNPASAVMAGMKIVIINCDTNGNIDIDDLQLKAEKYQDKLSAIMVTYPSTHGVYEVDIRKVCDLVHQYGGQVYMDGANMNALVGIATPGEIGSDVSHLNLHKTFAIPHGGGGPGVGPIGVKSHLIPFLPDHSVCPITDKGCGAVAGAPFGSASILTITWMYLKMLGDTGLKKVTQLAILNANYITEKLSAHYPILYRGLNNKVAHECIIDIRPIKAQSGISEEDIAKRLMDYGFHAPTMSFPVVGTLMIEPTESESLDEIHRFIDALLSIRQEIKKVEQGIWPQDNNPLTQAPHTLSDITDSIWDRPYSREEAVFPVPGLRLNKYWPTSNRVDNVFGDRNFVCSCPSIDSYKDSEIND